MQLKLHTVFHLITLLSLNESAKIPGRDEALVNDIPVVSYNLPPKVTDMKRLAWFAAATVCDDKLLVPLTCKACMEIKKANVSFVNLFENKGTGVKGYVSLDHSRNEIIVAFRGGQTLKNAFTFLKRNFVPFTPYAVEKRVQVHAGFKQVMESIAKDFVYVISTVLANPECQNYKIVVTGHSFGGAMATLAAIKIQQDLNLDWSRLSLYTFGQLRVGNRDFAQWYNTLPLTIGRGVNYNDPAPHTFYKDAKEYYTHIQNEVWINSPDASSYKICDNRYLEDPECSNSIPKAKQNMKAHIHFFDTDFSKEKAC